MHEHLIAECEREIRMRQRVYPKLVAGGKMTQRDADDQIWMMREIADILNNLASPPLPLAQAAASIQDKLTTSRDALKLKQVAIDAIFPFVDRDLRSIESSMTDDYLNACNLIKAEATNGQG